MLSGKGFCHWYVRGCWASQHFPQWYEADDQFPVTSLWFYTESNVFADSDQVMTLVVWYTLLSCS